MLGILCRNTDSSRTSARVDVSTPALLAEEQAASDEMNKLATTNAQAACQARKRPRALRCTTVVSFIPAHSGYRLGPVPRVQSHSHAQGELTNGKRVVSFASRHLAHPFGPAVGRVRNARGSVEPQRTCPVVSSCCSTRRRAAQPASVGRTYA
jgi:hypothetical protein